MLSRLRRPCIVRTPGVGTALEHRGFAQIQRALVLEVISKKRRLNLLAKIPSGGGLEVDLPQRVRIAAGPLAVVPRTDDDPVEVLTVVLFEGFVDREWSEEVFLIPPATNGECGHGWPCPDLLHSFL